jgi:hypothetical protein
MQISTRTHVVGFTPIEVDKMFKES